MLPTISIITPCYNSEESLENCIISVAKQEYPYLDHLIIDNLSTDKTAEILNRLRQKYLHIRVISEKDHGIYDAMNKGVKYSKGEWVHFLGSDDVLEPNILREAFSKADWLNLDFVYGDVRMKHSGIVYDGEFSCEKLIFQNICHQAIFYRRHLFAKLGSFDLGYSIWSDWEFNLRCFGAQVRKEHVPYTIAIFNEQGASSKGVDQAFLLDKPVITLKYFAGRVEPAELHRFLWPDLHGFVEKQRWLTGLRLMIEAGIRTRRPCLYVTAWIYWLSRHLFGKYFPRNTFLRRKNSPGSP